MSNDSHMTHFSYLIFSYIDSTSYLGDGNKESIFFWCQIYGGAFLFFQRLEKRIAHQKTSIDFTVPAGSDITT